jgi:predicted nucleic acid-binding protein
MGLTQALQTAPGGHCGSVAGVCRWADHDGETPDTLARAIALYEKGIDFADALHVAIAAECDGFATFDKALIKFAARRGIKTIAAP